MEEPGIRFSVKEVLDKLDRKLDTIEDLLRNKADAAAVTALAVQLDRLGRGEFNDAQRRFIADIAAREVAEASDSGWTRRQRILGALASLAVAGTLASSILIALLGRHG